MVLCKNQNKIAVHKPHTKNISFVEMSLFWVMDFCNFRPRKILSLFFLHESLSCTSSDIAAQNAVRNINSAYLPGGSSQIFHFISDC